MRVKNTDNGLIIVYTGNGKGKTTAALGLALRASGYQKKVLIVQFIKSWFTGEKKSLEKLPDIDFYQMGEGFVKILGDKKPFKEHKDSAKNALNFAQEKISSGKYNVVILDEINVAIREKLIPLSEIINIIIKKPKNVDLVITGRNAPDEIIELADLVTEMKEIKHPFQKGIKAKAGIDF
ncbi:cob(I)yrinic acid a,c-diamide adenosyltransferase [candidate division CPR3 bacterium GWF2_35_18]|uniref:Cob(I)alamin adenosyltransferase n=1 Tax=candidate division CPR3 bacterium GW2011_GWF2_35_18 TaxID=1618350 RepID=A0A0G0E3Y7_UNCC3|nr:MAG: Cob(I)alamin adenosyltransferase [candidate division CPR3 bacterium GW2011_GWF2_35_18]KKP86624.1 MAG: Cob(I)alamin adenosyltransferase [candidate division CPR3 bacterium GW2011_GWE2_35_7]OGB62863.1 MAG: cob(I)yrinic acid a,c-diamide adenosyltransferase [candidate division CPR3 bacterium GWF2_35_18]OGB65444.1 MAG: cob(I)yrinic acid a,c-diamide adenosyltransferase [candidate division CPR3 bacterium RIFOXYA2_FULL_35_13]OGB76757.1 MAG: cob(I)yrinic acid a,c-diamide adenosyltransferase [cand